jgi:hypothetical protein
MIRYAQEYVRVGLGIESGVLPGPGFRLVVLSRGQSLRQGPGHLQRLPI